MLLVNTKFNTIPLTIRHILYKFSLVLNKITLNKVQVYLKYIIMTTNRLVYAINYHMFYDW